MIENKVIRFLIIVLQVILYIPIQLIFIPITIVGFIYAFYLEIHVTKKRNVSFTAVQALQYRWIMHYFETRKDPLSIRFIKKFPCESHFGLLVTFAPLVIALKLFGFKSRLARMAEIGEETIATTPGRRLVMFDEILLKYIDRVDQIVIPGCGFDLMTNQYTKDTSVKIFEIDQTDSLNIKVETLQKANIPHDWITYIPVDFSKESWSQKLIYSGFDKTKRTLFIWQSVSLYLESELVDNILRDMINICENECYIAQDFYSKAFVKGDTSFSAKQSEKLMAKMGEPWKYGLDMSDNPKSSVETFLKDRGLIMTNYFQFGEKIQAEPFYCIVEAKKA